MGKEIERKFLVRQPLPYNISSRPGQHIMQAYISSDPDATVRLRVIDCEHAMITVKGITKGTVRNEWEYEIPVCDALDMMRQLPVRGLIDKTRIVYGRWELDIFHGKLDGLIIAEIELYDENETIEIPGFIGREVTGNPEYYNSSLGECVEMPPVI